MEKLPFGLLTSSVTLNWLSRLRIQDQFTGPVALIVLIALVVLIVLVVEVEHLSDCTGDAVKTALSDALPCVPVVFDESQHGGLVGDRMIDEVALGPRRNHEQGLARAVAATAESM